MAPPSPLLLSPSTTTSAIHLPHKDPHQFRGELILQKKFSGELQGYRLPCRFLVELSSCCVRIPLGAEEGEGADEDGARQDRDQEDRELHQPPGDLLQAPGRARQEGPRDRRALRRRGRRRHLLQRRQALRLLLAQDLVRPLPSYLLRLLYRSSSTSTIFSLVCLGN